MSTIRYIKEPFLARAISIVFVFASIILLSEKQKVFGAIALIIGLGLLFSSAINTGIEINTEKKSFRKLYSFLGIVFGEWESFPKTEYISVYKSRETLNSPAANWPTLTSNSYIVNSFWEDRRPITLCKANSKKEALAIARDMADVLGIKILDSTEGEQKWV
ncbi:hypothetical protein [Flavobacterium microcysteis]|uniref:Uncharacterized protein n=1 Tax=Flavobacterium microcysteis TaxID=2596891 RepID=A0A501QC10_9FLAO|nr:hypothetical protein [Flavobacterium microcysteis]TPD69938.1 hypothetical protein FJA49_08510 [Flavobacterium microcysteis]